MPTVSEVFSTAIDHHQAGHLQAAEQIYRQILAVEPNHADAWNLLGVLNSQGGNHQVAVDCLCRAIELAANVPAYHNNLGNVYQALTKHDEAVACYRRALELKPGYTEAHHNLGNVWQVQGNLDEAVACYHRALELKPDFAEAHYNLGRVWQAQGKSDDAVASFRRALELQHDLADAHDNLGRVYQEQGKRDKAAACFRRATEVNPDFAEAHVNLANVLQEMRKLDEAIASYRRALELKPDFAEAHNNLGNAFNDQGKWDEAVACYRRTLELMPDLAEAHDNLGNVLREQGKRDEAVTCYRRALELKPDFAEAHNNLGVVLKDKRKLDEALDCYRRALELKPDFAKAHNNLGNLWREQKNRDQAVACYRRALELEPDIVEAHFNLGNVLQELEREDEAVERHRRAVELKPDYGVAMSALVHELQHICQWKDVERLSERVIQFVDEDAKNVNAAPVSPFSFLTLPTITTAEQQLRCARQWVGRRLKSVMEIPRGPAWNRARDHGSKITVGYVSADFHSHATAQLTAELFEKHDRDRFSIFGYSIGWDDGSPMRRRLVNAFDRFVDLKDTAFEEAAQRIAGDGVQIAVDLKGYTMDSREEIFSLRPAPVQVSYLGYPSTMGAPFIDYVLVDDFVVPADQQPLYTEKLVHLPGCYQVNDSQREISPHTPSRAECRLPLQGFVFCCFNNNYKITPAVFAVWMKLLHAVPGSVLWLLEGNRFAPSNLRREAVARGIVPQRLVFAPRLPLAEHLARHRLADLFLDTFPVNAHTTASEALWAGCPVLTIAGETFVSRVAGSLLHTLDLPELVVTSLADYEAMALSLALDASSLADVRARLEANRKQSRLFDAEVFARNLERAYETMWQVYASGEQPRAFAISPT